MIELGELEKQHDEFAKRKVRVVVISNDDQATASKTQANFPHLVVVAGTEQRLAKAVEVLHPGAGPMWTDINAPTTFLLDGTGRVRWFFRPDSFLVRLPAADLLKAIDENR
jgi:peroxiredoxin